MTWTRIHSYAAEVELWTSLGINCWIIIGAIVFISTRMESAQASIEKQLARAVLWGGVAMSAISLGFFLFLLIALLLSNNPDRFSPDLIIPFLLMLAVIGLGAFAIFVGWKVGREK
jgi:CDP-diglyceride synthetase